jgi:hypothetical protein
MGTIVSSWSLNPFLNSIQPCPSSPYEIHPASGETYEIPHPDFIFVSPRGSYVVVVDSKDPKDVPHHISALLIERAPLLNGRKGRTPQTLDGGCAGLCCGDLKSFDLFFDLIREAGGTGAVYDTMIEC